VCLSVCLTGPERALFYTLEETRERNKCVEDVPSSKSFSYTLCLTRPVHLHVYTYISLLLHFETTRVFGLSVNVILFIKLFLNYLLIG